MTDQSQDASEPQSSPAHEEEESPQHEDEATASPDESHLTDSEDAEQTEDSQERAAPATADRSPVEIRWSRPTPALPADAVEEEGASGLSEFFDTLDEKLNTATGRITAAFRRPTGDQPAPVDYPAAQGDVDFLDIHGFHDAPARDDNGTGYGDENGYEDESEHPAEHSAEAGPLPGDELPPPPPPDSSSAPAGPWAAGFSQQAQLPDARLPDATRWEAAEAAADRDEETQIIPPVRIAAEERVSLPGPPNRAEANRGRRDLDQDRRRDVIWEKASAIEAATTDEDASADQEHADDEDDLYTYLPPYNLPFRDPDPPAQRSDLCRQVFVSLGILAALVSAAWMFGALPGPAILGGDGLSELSAGWFSGERALLAPAEGFYWLWPGISLLLIVYGVHQWTITQTSTPRQRRSGWSVGFASMMMLVWTASVHADNITLAALAVLAAASALVHALRQFNLHTARNSTERRLTDDAVGLFAGWAMVAATSAVSVWLTSMGVYIPGVPALLWALLGLLVCIWLAAYYAMTERGRITLALGMGWGMFWLIFPRLLSDLPSVWVAIGAAMGAFIVILATQSRRHRINHAERRAAMGRPVDDII